MSNHWPSACSVNKSDKMGRPGGGSAIEKILLTVVRTACSVKGVLCAKYTYYAASQHGPFQLCRSYDLLWPIFLSTYLSRSKFENL